VVHKPDSIAIVDAILAPPQQRPMSENGVNQFLFLSFSQFSILSVTLMDCVNKACRQFILYACRCGLPHAEFHKMMQHQHPSRIKTYTNQLLWTQCKHARYPFQNEVLVHYNVGEYGTSWRESLRDTLLGLWKANAMALTLTSEKEGRMKKYNINMLPSGWTHPHLWGVLSLCTVDGAVECDR
jgi:hypothetical protein